MIGVHRIEVFTAVVINKDNFHLVWIHTCLSCVQQLTPYSVFLFFERWQDQRRFVSMFFFCWYR